MKYLILFTALALAANIYSQDKKTMEEVQQIVKEVKTKFAPDRRTALFNITPKAIKGSVYIEGETNIPEAKTELFRKLAEKKVKCDDMVIVLPAKELGEKIYGVITVSAANLRTEPRHAAEMATQCLLGWPVKVLKKHREGWYLVQTPENYIAWVDDDAVALKTKSELDEYFIAKKVIYLDNFGFTNKTADVNSQVVSDLTKGNVLKVLQVKDNFTEVEYPDKRRAYVENSKIKNLDDWFAACNPTEESLVATAKTMMGIPYFWGGTSVKGLDCSGFTKTVYYLNGIYLPRDASQQVNVGELVDTKNGFGSLKPGDLLFFGARGNDSVNERVTHVGMYIGDYEFIHEGGKVMINSLDNTKENFSAYRFNSFIRAKRILGSINKNVIEKITSNKFYEK
jgi:cell wall-associated NlpC family hydrolase